MKKSISFLVISLTFLTLSVFGQKVKIKKGIASVDKQPYCKVEKEGNLFKKVITISNLNDEELIYIKSLDIQLFYEVNFLASKRKMTFQQTALSNFSKAFVKKLYNSKLIENGKINSSLLDKFILKYSTEVPDLSANQNETVVVDENSSAQFSKVHRDISKPIYVYGNRIEQDFKTIGSVTSNINSSSFFIGSTTNKIAQVSFTNNGTTSSAVIQTYSDNKIKTLTVNFVDRNKEIAQYLVQHNYL